MSFARTAWKIVVGVKDVLALLFLLLFFLLLAAALGSRDGARGGGGGGALTIPLRGVVVEEPTSATFGQALGGQRIATQFRLRDLVAGLDAAARDDAIKTVVLDLDGFGGGGQVALTDIGAALDRVRARKPVLAFASGYTDDSYQLAAHASEIWLDPLGLALFAGPGGSRLYYKGLLDRLGVQVHVYRVGQFKSAVEPFILDRQSPAAAEANRALAGALWDRWREDVGRARPRAQVAQWAADPVAATANGTLAEAALRAGIVDHLATRDAFEARVTQLAGAATRTDRDPLPFRAVAWNDWRQAHGVKDTAGDGAVGIVTVAGTIEDGEAPSGLAGGETLARLIERAVASGKFRALVVRIDSPGGSALASDRIRTALLSAKRRGLPVVASMGNVAASGGYWVSTAADAVYAEPATITGSIGVFGIIPTFQATLAKIGVNADGVRTTPLSGEPDIYGGTNTAFDTVIQRSVEATYGRFIAIVAGARGLQPARVGEIAQGRVWDGGSARQLGLVTNFGGLDAAVADAARRARLDPARPHARWIERGRGWREALTALLTGSTDTAATDLPTTMTQARLREAATAITDATRLATGAVVQTRCLECPLTPVATPPTATTLAARVAAWLGG